MNKYQEALEKLEKLENTEWISDNEWNVTKKENPYSYDINFYPLKESILHGIFDATYEKPTSNTENSLELKE